MRSRKDVEVEFQVCHLDVLFEYLFQRFGEGRDMERKQSRGYLMEVCRSEEVMVVNNICCDGGCK